MTPPSNKNMDVVPINRTDVLTREQVKSLRLREPRELTDRDTYHPDINLFAEMYQLGPEWAQEYVEEYHADKTEYDDDTVDRASHELAVEMTEAIQWLYDISLPDREVGNMYGMTRDYAMLALGHQIPIPNYGRRKSQFREPVAGGRRIKRYLRQKDDEQNITETGE